MKTTATVAGNIGAFNVGKAAGYILKQRATIPGSDVAREAALTNLRDCSTLHKNAATIYCGAVVGNRAAIHGHVATEIIVDATAAARGRIAGKGAIRDGQLAQVVNRTGIQRAVARNRAVRNGDNARVGVENRAANVACIVGEDAVADLHSREIEDGVAILSSTRAIAKGEVIQRQRRNHAKNTATAIRVEDHCLAGGIKCGSLGDVHLWYGNCAAAREGD